MHHPARKLPARPGILGCRLILDWGVYALLVLSWRATATIAERFGRPVHVYEPAQADRWLFGGRLPTITLQGWLADPGHQRWYDWAATVQYLLHFLLPVAVGWLIWRRSRRVYWRFTASVLSVFALGFAGYVLYPAAPPWMAAEFEAIPPVYRVMGEAVQHVSGSVSMDVVPARLDVNEVAAIPSLHAALPLLLALVLVRLWGRRMLLTLLYPLTMGFNVVYSGEHYVVDVLAGYGVALAAYGLVWVLPDLWRRRGLPGLVRLPPITHRAERRLSAALVSVAMVVVFLLYRHGPANAIASGACAEVESVADASPLLAGVAGRYAAYIVDVEGEQCYMLTADGAFPPPRAGGVPVLAARAPVRLRPAAGRLGGAEFVSLRIGMPPSAVAEPESPRNAPYLLVVQLADIGDPEQAAHAVDELEAQFFAPSGAP